MPNKFPTFFKSILFLFIGAFPFKGYSLTELSGSFGYERTIYGSERQNKITKRTYSGSLAFYFFGTTALEFNYSDSTDTNIDNTVSGINGFTLDIVSRESLVHTQVYGIGIRQALSSSKSFLRPMISLGYAKKFAQSQSSTTITNTATGTTFVIPNDRVKTRTDSVFGSFRLQLRITKGLRLNASVNTVFKAFEWNQAKDNMRYLAGFSWMF